MVEILPSELEIMNLLSDSRSLRNLFEAPMNLRDGNLGSKYEMIKILGGYYGDAASLYLHRAHFNFVPVEESVYNLFTNAYIAAHPILVEEEERYLYKDICDMMRRDSA